jgi:hypothetical protein
MTNTLAAGLVFAVLVFAVDVPPQCSQQVYARTNPSLCGYFPFPDLGGAPNPAPGGGGGGGGLISGILHHLGL